MVKWKVLLQLMGLMSRSLILVLLKSPDAPDLHSKGSALESLLSSRDRRHQPLFHSIPPFVEWKIFTTQSMKCTCQQLFISLFSKSNQEKIILCIDFCETLVCKFQTCTNAWFVYYVPVQLVRRRVLFKSRSIGVTTFWIQILRPSGLRPTSTSFPHHITARRKSAENPPVAQWAEGTFLNPRHCC